MLGLNLTLSSGRGLPFNPSRLFRSGEQGVWYDPSDFSTMFQDAEGTVPVTAVEQPVGRILDKSGRGFHATQVTATSRPVLRQDGNGKYYLYFDGVDDWLVTPTITPGIDKVQVFAGVRKLSDAAAGVVVETGNTYWTVNGFSVQASTRSTNAGASSPFATYYAALSDGTGTQNAEFDVFNTQNVYPSPSTNTISAVFDRGAAPLSKTNLRVNGVVPTKVTGDFTGTGVTGNVLNTPLYIGMRAGLSLPFNGHLYSLIVRFGPNLPIGTIEQVEAWINGKTGAY